ncbi:hypothetical protein [Cryobacterium melibiosiphilum]|nr:hypothetical protein [Cryobacterium melibiosiphilum]
MSRWTRVGRGSLTASVAVLLAALSHLAAGGTAPALLGIVVALAFAVPVSVLLAGRTLSLFRLSLAVGVSQLLLHALFGLGAASPSALSIAGHHGLVTVAADSASVAALHSGGAMWLAHGLAALLTVVALRRGERAACALLQFAQTQLRTVLIAFSGNLPVLIPLAAVRTALVSAIVPTLLAVLLSPMRHRGPPQVQTAF